MKFTCTSWSWSLLTFEEVVRVMCVLGFRTIDVGAFAGFAHFEPAELARRPKEIATQLIEIGRRYGMDYSDLFVTFGNDLADRCVNFPEKTVRDENLETFRRITEFCEAAGVPGITLCPGVQHPNLGRAACLDLAVEELARLSEAGHQAGLRVSFEPHLESITESPQEALEVVTSVPHLKLTLDYSHFVAQGYAESDIEPLLPHTAHFHARQAKKGMLQARTEEGAVDFERAISVLQSVGYAGWVAIEYEWNAWQGNNRVDVLSETLLLKRRLEKFGA